jgi:5-methylcytosine-specific restriction endonuclease McrA
MVEKAATGSLIHTPWNKGKHLLEKTKRKLSKAKKGEKNPNFGKPLSTKHKRNISEAQKGEKGYWFGKYHSKETKRKMSKNRKGEKSYLWKGGITPINEQIRHSFEMKEWRLMVFGRDNYTCQGGGCRARGVYLNAHHIKPFSTHPELRFEVSNGITLCQKCHEKIKGKEEELAPLLQTIVLNRMIK